MIGRRPSPSAGAHIRVKRNFFYWHHAIYVAEDRVIQLGGRVFEKWHASLEVVSLSQFAKGGTVRVVTHSLRRKLIGPVGPPGEPEEIIRRAEWLLLNHPPGRYNLIGWNCESAATFCVNGLRESSQVRRVMAVMGVSMFPLWTFVNKGDRPSWKRHVWLWVLYAVILVLVWAYNHYSRRIWLDLEAQWTEDHPQVDSSTQ